jgi:hypothetical protein
MFADVLFGIMHLIQTICFAFTTTAVDVNSVYVGENLDLGQQLNQQMFDHHFSY